MVLQNLKDELKSGFITIVGAVHLALTWENVNHLLSEEPNYHNALDCLHHASIVEYLSHPRFIFVDALRRTGNTYLCKALQKCIKVRSKLSHNEINEVRYIYSTC